MLQSPYQADVPYPSCNATSITTFPHMLTMSVDYNQHNNNTHFYGTYPLFGYNPGVTPCEPTADTRGTVTIIVCCGDRADLLK